MIEIFLSQVYSIKDMVAQLSPIFSLKSGSFANLKIDMNVRMIYPEYLILIVAAYNWAKENNIKLYIDIIKKDDNRYPYRINFYKLIDSKEKEPFFNRFSNLGKFIEITPLKFNSITDEQIDPCIVTDIVKIFRNNYKIEDSIYKSLNYCIWEQVDNIQNHSGDYGTGFVVAQNYPNLHEIRLCIVDTGIGIYESLTKTESSKFKDLSYKEAIRKCIETKVTNGKGLGNGLYHSARFALNNKGCFVIYSGNYYIEINDGEISQVIRGKYWQGTIIFQKVYTNNKINYNDVFNNCPIPTTVEECDDMFDGLWD